MWDILEWLAFLLPSGRRGRESGRDKRAIAIGVSLLGLVAGIALFDLYAGPERALPIPNEAKTRKILSRGRPVTPDDFGKLLASGKYDDLIPSLLARGAVADEKLEDAFFLRTPREQQKSLLEPMLLRGGVSEEDWPSSRKESLHSIRTRVLYRLLGIYNREDLVTEAIRILETRAGKDGLHSLVWALAESDRDFAEDLLRLGADPFVRDSFTSAIERAISGRKVDRLALFLKYVPDLKPIRKPPDSHFSDSPQPEWPHLLLRTAVAAEAPEIMDLLVARGADPTHADPLTGETLLHQAVRNNAAAVLSRLGDVPVDARDNYGRTAMHIAAARGYLLMTAWLASQGAAIDANARNGETPLHLAAYYSVHSDARGPDAADLLIEAGSPVNARDRDGATPLHHILAPANTPAFLLGEVLYADAPNRYPHLSSNHPATIQSLLGHGADPAARDVALRTPLHYCLDATGHNMARTRLESMVKAGADPLLPDAGGDTVFDRLGDRQEEYALLAALMRQKDPAFEPPPRRNRIKTAPGSGLNN